MDHRQFKANQTAADYVAAGLDDDTQEAFELHMMGCAECLSDVEAWRAIKANMTRGDVARAPVARRLPLGSDWRWAASILGAGVVGATGGWVAKSGQGSELEAAQTLVFNIPAVTRGAQECLPLRLSSRTHTAVLRVPGVARERRVIALDSQQQELPKSKYSTRLQPDGSQIVQMSAAVLNGHTIELQARGADGSIDPLTCVTGESDREQQ
jgi:hypothetical protein